MFCLLSVACCLSYTNKCNFTIISTIFFFLFVQYQNEQKQRDCKECSAGKWSDAVALVADTQCKLCTSGRYSTKTGLSLGTHCILCSEGKFSTEKGKDSKCTDNCPKGTFSNTTGLSASAECEKCPGGKFSEDLGAIFCAGKCPAGKFSDEIGFDSETLCEKKCSAGKYSDTSGIDSDSLCKRCSAGKFSDKVGLVSDSNCDGYCSLGKWSNETGLTSDEDCIGRCSAGRFGSSPGLSADEDCNPCSAGRYSMQEGFTSELQCKICGEGTFSLPGDSSCTLCPKGYFNNGTTVLHLGCFTCPEGSFSGFEGAVDCNSCPLGSREIGSRENGELVCRTCPSGFFLDEVLNVKQQECKPCTVGLWITKDLIKFSDHDSEDDCKPCPAGSIFSEDASSFGCNVCSSGKYSANSDQNLRACINCPSGTFLADDSTDLSRHDNTDDCLQCAQNFYSEAGSSICEKFISKDDCNDDEFLDDSSSERTEHICKDCPAGGSCVGDVNASEIVALFGYSRCPVKAKHLLGGSQQNRSLINNKTNADNSGSLIKFGKCAFAAACLGAKNRAFDGKFEGNPALIDNLESCNTAYVNDSLTCGSCATDFSKVGTTGKCDACPPATENGLIAAVGVLTGVIGICVYVRLTLDQFSAGFNQDSDGVMSIALTFFQTLWLLTSFPIEWPDIFVGIFQVGGIVTVLGQHLVNLKCMFPANSDADVFFAMQVLWACALPVLVVLTVILWLIFARIWVIEDLWRKIRASSVALIYLVWPTLCSQAFQMFSCRVVCGELYLRADLHEPCFAGRHFLYAVILGIPLLIFYVAGLPCLMLLQVYRMRQLARQSISSDRTRTRLMRLSELPDHAIYGRFYSPFLDQYWYWEVRCCL